MANIKKIKEETIAPDGGWGWMVAIGSFIILFLMPLVTICFSILFSDFLLEQEASSSTTAWIFNIHALLWNLMGPFSGPLSKEFGFRKICWTGSILAAASLFACAFSTSTSYLMMCFSLVGLFGGMTCKPCYLIIPLYFDKRRGLANAIIMTGMCTGQFVGPPVIRFLQRQYGFTGATIIASSLLLNCCVGAAFFHPVQWHWKTTIVESLPDSSSLHDTSEKEDQATEVESLVDEKAHQDHHHHPPPSHPPHAYKDLLLANKYALRTRRRRVSESSNVSSVAVSMIDLSSISNLPPEEKIPGSSSTSLKSPENISKGRSLPRRVISSLISDLGILKYHRAKIIAFGGLFLINGYLNFLMTVPFAVQAAGYTPEDAAWCISITGVCNFVARLSASVLSDYSWFKMRLTYVLGAVIIATTTGIFSFLTDLTWMKITLGFWALGIGINISLYILVMPRVMGLENMSAIFGTQSLVVGIGYVMLGPLIGFVRDVSGSYTVSILMMSAEVWMCVILWCFMPAAESRDKKKDLQEEEEEEAKEANSRA